jgi:hypothetical protein
MFTRRYLLGDDVLAHPREDYDEFFLIARFHPELLQGFAPLGVGARLCTTASVGSPD